MRLGDLDALKDILIQRRSELTGVAGDLGGALSGVIKLIDNAPTFDVTENQAYDQGFITAMRIYSRPQGECKDCDNCEDKALSYSMGFQDGYLLGGFQLTELRRWLTSQGYSEGTVDDKIENFRRFLERIRGEEE